MKMFLGFQRLKKFFCFNRTTIGKCSDQLFRKDSFWDSFGSFHTMPPLSLLERRTWPLKCSIGFYSTTSPAYTTGRYISKRVKIAHIWAIQGNGLTGVRCTISSPIVASFWPKTKSKLKTVPILGLVFIPKRSYQNHWLFFISRQFHAIIEKHTWKAIHCNLFYFHHNQAHSGPR